MFFVGLSLYLGFFASFGVGSYWCFSDIILFEISFSLYARVDLGQSKESARANMERFWREI